MREVETRVQDGQFYAFPRGGDGHSAHGMDTPGRYGSIFVQPGRLRGSLKDSNKTLGFAGEKRTIGGPPQLFESLRAGFVDERNTQPLKDDAITLLKQFAQRTIRMLIGERGQLQAFVFSGADNRGRIRLGVETYEKTTGKFTRSSWYRYEGYRFLRRHWNVFTSKIGKQAQEW
jgi:hypothetical protein